MQNPGSVAERYTSLIQIPVARAFHGEAQEPCAWNVDPEAQHCVSVLKFHSNGRASYDLPSY